MTSHGGTDRQVIHFQGRFKAFPRCRRDVLTEG